MKEKIEKCKVIMDTNCPLEPYHLKPISYILEPGEITIIRHNNPEIAIKMVERLNEGFRPKDTNYKYTG